LSYRQIILFNIHGKLCAFDDKKCNGDVIMSNLLLT